MLYLLQINKKYINGDTRLTFILSSQILPDARF